MFVSRSIELSSLQVTETAIDHDLDVHERQVVDQMESLETQRRESNAQLHELQSMTVELKNEVSVRNCKWLNPRSWYLIRVMIFKAQSLLEGAISNKKAHLKRLEDDIFAKMEDTHALNRECDKATICVSEQEHSVGQLALHAQSAAVQASDAQHAKKMAAERAHEGELALDEVQREANISEQRLSTRIESSKASIAAFFALKKEANAKEWELSKAKASLAEAVDKQRRILSGLESDILVASVKLTAETREASDTNSNFVSRSCIVS